MTMKEAGTISTKLQEDEDIVNIDSKKIVAKSTSSKGKNYTLNIITDPRKNIPPLNHL